MTINEQNHPIEDGSESASHEERLDGIVEQVTQDVRLGHTDDAAAELRQRLGDSGIELADSDFDRLVERIDSAR
ncbi:hypothetical protein [Marisediminicola sp. LYQ134]|uniref:hypothetical protein n=1 Tax=unclassified Marisediminicola TaxID=2618316 RepID=UPI003983A7E6